MTLPQEETTVFSRTRRLVGEETTLEMKALPAEKCEQGQEKQAEVANLAFLPV